MALIRSLKANVTEEEAKAEFSPGGIWDYLHTAALGPLRSVAEFYVPFLLFQVTVTNAEQTQRRVFGIDGVTGSLDLYEFDELPTPEQVVYLDTRNCAKPLLDEAKARELIITKVQRLLFQSGFFRLRNFQISAELVPGEIHVPYWVGFRGVGPIARLAVMDAVRRRREGAKVRSLVETWLTSIRTQA